MNFPQIFKFANSTRKPLNFPINLLIRKSIFIGTRFRPLSLDTPKPLFPIAGLEIVKHHVEAAIKLSNLKEILVIGSYTSGSMEKFVSDIQNEYPTINLRYLQEFTELGTAGGNLNGYQK